MAADNSPSWSKTARIAAASASVTTNISTEWGFAACPASHRPQSVGKSPVCRSAMSRHGLAHPCGQSGHVLRQDRSDLASIRIAVITHRGGDRPVPKSDHPRAP
jgi:hypothetical protein